MAHGATNTPRLLAALSVFAAAAIFHAANAEAQWTITVSHTPAFAGEKSVFNVALNARGAVKVPQLSVTCRKDPDLNLVLSTMPAGPGRRSARYEYTFPKSASGVWVFSFLLTEDGQAVDQNMQVVVVQEARPAPAGAWQTLPGSTAPAPPLATPTPAPPPTPQPLYTISTPAPLQTPQSAFSGPDLSIVLLDAPPEIAGAPGEKRILRYRVENIGGAAAEGMEIRYGADSRFSEDKVAAVFEPGMRLTGKTTWDLDADMKEVWIEALIQGQPDGNPENSRAARPVRLTEPSAYELAATDLTVAGAAETVRAGSSVEIRLYMKNPGPNPIDVPFTVTLTGLGTQPMRRTFAPPFPAGKERVVVFHARVPDDESGRLSLSAFADSSHVLQERDETDNSFSREWRLTR